MEESLNMGFLASGLASLAFALMYVPVKYYPTYDGITFQWFLCSGVWTCGYVLNWVGQFGGRDQLEMTLGLIGGGMWACANYLVVPTMQLIGLGPGFAVFNVANLIVGYATGRFGLFGVPASPTTWLGDLGLGVLVLSFFFMLRVSTGPPSPSASTANIKVQKMTLKPNQRRSPEEKGNDYQPLTRDAAHPTLCKRRNSRSILFGAIPGAISSIGVEVEEQEVVAAALPPSTAENYRTFTSADLENLREQLETDEKYEQKIAQNIKQEQSSKAKQEGAPALNVSPIYQKSLGFLLATISGVIMGSNLIPYLHWQRDHPGAHPWAYVTAHASGAYLASTMIYLVYSTYAKLKSTKVPHSGIRPAFISGIIWSVGFALNLVALRILGYSTGYTLGAIGPVMLTSGLSYAWFGEVSDPSSVRAFCIALILQVIGVGFVAMGRDDSLLRDLACLQESIDTSTCCKHWYQLKIVLCSHQLSEQGF
eukprot:CAMPEP_0184499430 /NCGR_PEP_ID=MMETSP0113_2-20130426/41502_1 /TAXON_ID=91329 /ORGANISM="Norrisiella sphaerica, Strain BC52" /LENGTH=479 /DNA_ID=CAMNT_0026887345 /DNA_START=302 /DNA_END=1742 /DNA_ORIENTATION=-